jgi:hypothetical protein
VVCGKPFWIAQRAAWNQKTCSIACRYERHLRGTLLRDRRLRKQARSKKELLGKPRREG